MVKRGDILHLCRSRNRARQGVESLGRPCEAWLLHRSTTCQAKVLRSKEHCRKKVMDRHREESRKCGKHGTFFVATYERYLLCVEWTSLPGQRERGSISLVVEEV